MCHRVAAVQAAPRDVEISGASLALPDGRDLSTAHFVVEYDSSGHVWVAPPGAYDTYNRGQDFDANPDVCLAAVG